MSHLCLNENREWQLDWNAFMPAYFRGTIQQQSSSLFFVLLPKAEHLSRLCAQFLRHVLVVRWPMCLSRKRASVETAASRPIVFTAERTQLFKTPQQNSRVAILPPPSSTPISHPPPLHYTFASMVPKSPWPTRPHPRLVTLQGYNLRAIETNKHTHGRF